MSKAQIYEFELPTQEQNLELWSRKIYHGFGKCVVIMVFYTFPSVVMKEEEEDEGEIVEETVDILLEVTEEFVD